jgi:hypothetical protein
MTPSSIVYQLNLSSPGPNNSPLLQCLQALNQMKAKAAVLEVPFPDRSR